MFRIYPEPVWQAYEEMEKERKGLQAQEEAVDSVIRCLESMEGFDTVIGACRSSRGRLHEAQEQMNRLRDGLGEALQRYRYHENRILETGEHVILYNRKARAGEE